MPDPIHLQLDRLGDVVADELETGMTDPMGNVGLAPGEIVVEADHLLPGLHQPVDQMGAKKAGTACNQIAREGSGHLLSSGRDFGARPTRAQGSCGVRGSAAASQARCGLFRRTQPALVGRQHGVALHVLSDPGL